MRDSSYQSSKQHKQMFSRGGEKKVMKKSLSLLLAIAMVFGMFASVASAAEAELTAQQKFEALKAKGIFTGINEAGDAGLDQKMNRAQFARVAALILGLEGIGNPDTLKVTENPFPDVKKDAWYAEEVAAVKAAGLMVGNADGTFNPTGDISVQELAVVVAALLDLEAVEGAEVEGAADWAAPYIKAITDAGIDFPTNYTEAATREQLVNISYVADQKINPVEPAKVSVSSAKAVGVKKVEVQLDKAVDTEKAKFELKLGSVVVALEKTEWSEDKKTATLFLKDTTIREGNYTVTLSGVEDIATASASFKGEKETVTKIEFVTASDEIAKSKKAKIKVRPENQYGELASFSVSAYTVNTADVTSTKKIDDQGYLIITADTSKKDTGIGVVPVYVYHNDTRVMANKTFRVGASAFVQKMEIGEVEYSNVDNTLAKSGNTATVPVTLLDQYGNPVTPEQVVADNLTVNWNSYVTPFNEALVVKVEDKDDAYKAQVSIAANKKIEKSGTYQINLFAGAATSTFNVEVSSVRVAKNVEIGQPTKTIAAGDDDAIIPIIVTDEAGNELTPDEIVDNKDRIEISSNAGELIEYGKDKGKVRVKNIPATKNSFFSLTVMIKSDIGGAPGYDNEQFQVGETRVPTRLDVTKEAAAKAVLSGAKTKFEVVVKDQYGEVLKKPGTNADLDGTYTVVATVYNATYATATGKGDNNGNVLNAGTNSITYNYNRTDTATGFGNLVGGFEFETTTAANSVTSTQPVEVKFSLLKGTEVVATKNVRLDVIDPKSNDLSYSLENVGELFAALDKKASYLNGVAQEQPENSKVAKKAKLVVRDSANNIVAFPDRVTDIVTSDPNVAQAAAKGDYTLATGEGFVLGNKAGTAKVSVYFVNAKGETKVLTSDVTVKADPIVIKSISMKDTFKYSTTLNVYNDLDLKVTDQYGITLEKDDVRLYDKYAGVRFIVSDVTASADTNNTVTIDANGNVTVGSNVTAFVITAISRDGSVSAVTEVTR